MKNLIAVVFVMWSAGGEEFLNDITLYKKDSYFKNKVYTEHDYKSFYALKEVNAVIDPDNYDLHLLNAAVFFATNKMRADKNQKQLKFSAALRDAAVVHTQQMVEKKFFNHFNNRIPKLHTPHDRMKLFGIDADAEGENVDLNDMDMPGKTTYMQLAEMIVDDFYHSPEHKKTMLSKTYSYLGCSAVFETSNKDGVRYFKATQDYSSGK